MKGGGHLPTRLVAAPAKMAGSKYSLSRRSAEMRPCEILVIWEVSWDLIRKLVQKSCESGNKSYSSHQLV